MGKPLAISCWLLAVGRWQNWLLASVSPARSTLETWKRFIPEDRYEIKGKPAEIIVCGRVKILTGGLDNSELINKFNSAEYAFFFLDQAEEIDAEQIGELRAMFRLRFLIVYC